jgi:hypothetical protein
MHCKTLSFTKLTFPSDSKVNDRGPAGFYDIISRDNVFEVNVFEVHAFEPQSFRGTIFSKKIFSRVNLFETNGARLAVKKLMGRRN